MSKGKLDFSYNVTFQSERKKDKPSNCIYLIGGSKNRVCQHKDNFGAYCFDSKNCKYRVKETVNGNDNKSIENSEKPCKKSIKIDENELKSMVGQCYHHSIFGHGKVVAIGNKTLIFDFEGKTKNIQYEMFLDCLNKKLISKT